MSRITSDKLSILFFILLLYGSATYDVQYNDSATGWQDLNQNKDEEVDHTFYLMGDGGKSDINLIDSNFSHLKKELSIASKNSTVLYLGDNVYEHGMPEKSNPEREKAEKILDAQISIIENYNEQSIFIPGNHDYYNQRPDDLLRAVEAAGIPVLQNRSVELRRDGQSLSLAGVDDLLLGRPDLEAALAGTRPPVVLLSHNPDMFFDAARADVALVLSGHTHAGQVRVPGLPVLVRQSRYRLDEGRYRVGRTELVVSRGLGAVGVPFRANCPPEVVLLRLRRAAG